MLLSDIIAHTTHLRFLGCPSHGDLNIPLTEESGRSAEVRRLALPAAMAAGSTCGRPIRCLSWRPTHELRVWSVEGFDFEVVLVLRGGVPRSLGDFPDILAQRLLLCGFSVCGLPVLSSNLDVPPPPPKSVSQVRWSGECSSPRPPRRAKCGVCPEVSKISSHPRVASGAVPDDNRAAPRESSEREREKEREREREGEGEGSRWPRLSGCCCSSSPWFFSRRWCAARRPPAAVREFGLSGV